MQKIFFTALIGSLISLDQTVFLQIMISQPIVCGTIIGWFLGNIQFGVLIGILLQLIWIKELSLGGTIPPDSTIATIIGVSIPLIINNTNSLSTFISIIIGILAGISSMKTEIITRKINNKIAQKVENLVKMGKFEKISIVNWQGILIAFTKSFLLIFLVLIITIPFLTKILIINIYGIWQEMFKIFLLLLGLAIIIEKFLIKQQYIYILITGFLFAFILNIFNK